jgi:hypothetical protein
MASLRYEALMLYVRKLTDKLMGMDMNDHADQSYGGGLSRREIILGTATLSASLVVLPRAKAMAGPFKYDTPPSASL